MLLCTRMHICPSCLRFVIALCRLLGEFFSKSKDKKELMEKLNAVSNALKVTRHSGQWLR